MITRLIWRKCKPIECLIGCILGNSGWTLICYQHRGNEITQNAICLVHTELQWPPVKLPWKKNVKAKFMFGM